MRQPDTYRFAAVAIVAVIFAGCSSAYSQIRSASVHRSEITTLDWPVYGGQAAGDHYSSLSQINRKNVHGLQLAWKFDGEEEGGLETSPIIVGRVLYAYTATQKVIALDAASGKLIWKFDSGIKGKNPVRGLSYWTDGKESRIFAPVTNFLYALDANTGKPVPTFAEDGSIDLRKDLRGDYLNTGKYVWKIPLGEYPALAAKGMTNTASENYGGPIVTAGDVLVIGATVYGKKFRAFDRLTGELLWETVLPNAAVATPATYMIDGKQYVVVAAGGGKDPKASSGSVYVAFALPSASPGRGVFNGFHGGARSHRACPARIRRQSGWRKWSRRQTRHETHHAASQDA